MTALGQSHIKAPVLGVVEAFKPHWVADVLKYAVAIGGALGLAAAATSAMLGVSRVGYSLATNRQIPSAIGRLHPRWGTPFVIMSAAAVAAAALVLPTDLELLVGIFAFGALLSFTIAHLSVIALRFREPDRAARLPGAALDPVGGASVPMPAVLGALLSFAGWVAVLVVPLRRALRRARLAAGRAGPLCHLPQDRVQAAAAAGDDPRAGAAPRGARARVRLDPGSDLRQRARRRHRADRRPAGRRRRATARTRRLGDRGRLGGRGAALAAARRAAARRPGAAGARRARPRQGGGGGVRRRQVATTVVRARRAGQAIVTEARERGVEAIVLAAEEPSRIRGGALFGGAGGPLDNFVGEITKYVIRKAPCRVILTAPPAAQLRRRTPTAQAKPRPNPCRPRTRVTGMNASVAPGRAGGNG